MRRFTSTWLLPWIVAALGALGLGACDSGSGGGDSPTCPSSNCQQSCGDCERSCLGGNCQQTCTGGTCSFQCTGANCHQTCRAGTSCTATCGGGNCTQVCEASALCTFSCTGGNCR